MGTYAVPGANAKHDDVLSIGCWAENPDGSRLLVTDLSNGLVSYQIFNINNANIAYNDSKTVAIFEKFYSDKDNEWFLA